MMNVKPIPQNDGISERVDDAIERAYWEYQRYCDASQPPPNYGEHFAFKLAVQNMLVGLRGRQAIDFCTVCMEPDEACSCPDGPYDFRTT